jgi:hemerythrin-like metal-binding protein
MSGPAPIPESDAMLTGVPEIDRQHRILVDALIEARASLSGDAADPLFERITRDLLAYAIYHFDAEEQAMRRHRYDADAPDAAAMHLTEHRRFSERVVALRQAARMGEPGSRAALLSFLEDWLANHIKTVDKRLGQFILGKR